MGPDERKWQVGNENRLVSQLYGYQHLFETNKAKTIIVRYDDEITILYSGC